MIHIKLYNLILIIITDCKYRDKDEGKKYCEHIEKEDK